MRTSGSRRSTSKGSIPREIVDTVHHRPATGDLRERRPAAITRTTGARGRRIMRPVHHRAPVCDRAAGERYRCCPAGEHASLRSAPRVAPPRRSQRRRPPPSACRRERKCGAATGSGDRRACWNGSVSNDAREEAISAQVEAVWAACGATCCCAFRVWAAVRRPTRDDELSGAERHALPAARVLPAQRLRSTGAELLPSTRGCCARGIRVIPIRTATIGWHPRRRARAHRRDHRRGVPGDVRALLPGARGAFSGE